ncbi:MAG: hypothetical protein ACJAQT_002873 [Akkermansiaceae bacterium]|jgi:hypothetical protein
MAIELQMENMLHRLERRHVHGNSKCHGNSKKFKVSDDLKDSFTKFKVSDDLKD